MVTKSESKAAPAAAATPINGSEHDIIDDLLAHVIALSPGFSAAIAKQVDKAVREGWAGDRPYIAKRSGEGSSQRNALIKADYLKGERMALLERRYKLSRSRLWEIIKG